MRCDQVDGFYLSSWIVFFAKRVHCFIVVPFEMFAQFLVQLIYRTNFLPIIEISMIIAVTAASYVRSHPLHVFCLRNISYSVLPAFAFPNKISRSRKIP